MKCTVKQFEQFILPALKAEAKNADDLKTRIGSWTKQNEVTDEAGAIVDLQVEMPTHTSTVAVDGPATVVISGAIADSVDTFDNTPNAAVSGMPKNVSIQAVIKSTIEAMKKEAKVVDNPVAQAQNKGWEIPASAKKFPGCNKSFRGEIDGITAEQRAYGFGRFVLASLGHKASQKWCQDNGISTKAASLEGTDAGVLVPDQFVSDIISLQLEYGTFQRNAKIIPMTGETSSRPRRTGGLTAYFVGEAAAGTESKGTWDKVQLTTKKVMVLSRMSNELNDDAVISVGSDTADQMARAIAYKIDLCGWTGTGTSTYSGIVGVSPAMATLYSAAAGVGQVLGAGNLFSEIIAGNILEMIGKCPTYARARGKFYCSPVVAYAVLARLAAAQGGSPSIELINGFPMMRFWGYPVEMVEVLPTVDTTVSTEIMFFGDLSQAADFGSRNQVGIATSDSAVIGGESTFEQDEIAMRGTTRFDINVHDVGSSTVAGPMVSLITAAS